MTPAVTGGPPGIPLACLRGLAGCCPRCGRGRVFAGFLRVAERCEPCGLALGGHRADDLPPYLVIFVVGHLMGFAILETESRFEAMPLAAAIGLWSLVTLALALGLMRPAKGAVVGLQYALGMHGFGAARRRDLDGMGAGEA